MLLILRLVWSSMAAPHVAGVAALYLSAHPNATPQEVKQVIIDGATQGKLDSGGKLKGTPNKIVYSLVNAMSPGSAGI